MQFKAGPKTVSFPGWFSCLGNETEQKLMRNSEVCVNVSMNHAFLSAVLGDGTALYISGQSIKLMLLCPLVHGLIPRSSNTSLGMRQAFLYIREEDM